MALMLAKGWRLIDDGERQWILQRENPKAKDERNRWRSVAFCGTQEGLVDVALPHHDCQPTEAASYVLKRLPPYFQPGCLPIAEADVMEPCRVAA